MSNGLDQRIRHVAIVLQSLDAATSRGLLGQLPPAQSKLVRQAMVHLGTVTPQERESAFQSMQGLLSESNTRVNSERSGSAEGVSPAAALVASQQSAMSDQFELSPEALQQDQKSNDGQRVAHNFAKSVGSGTWQHMPAEALADILQNERPIVIATVINQVSVERATAIAQALPMRVAAATLAALPHLHLTDAAILRDIQLELERKIGLYQAPKQATAEGLSKLQAIVASMPHSQQDDWTKAIAQSNPGVATKLGWKAEDQFSQLFSLHESSNKSVSTAQTTAIKSFAIPTSTVGPQDNLVARGTNSLPVRTGNAIGEDIFDESIILPFQHHAITRNDSTTELKQTVVPKSSEAAQESNVIENLLQLSDKDFVTVLHACQPQTVLLALSGATKAFVLRVERLVPGKDVKRLRARLNSLGPIHLRDVDAAQTRIAETAMQLQAKGKVGAINNVSFIAAA